ncbi:MAG TPA: hypothetical protein PLH56_03620 [Candidatus Omnitrophota bacterium]|nr:hypothetical protein [Candidatus Omnitrophota bacterium]
MPSDFSEERTSLCPLFGECGGCSYQDIPYEKELIIKNNLIMELLSKRLLFSKEIFQPIVPSPQEYYYRHRLDLKFVRTKDNRELIGFTPQSGKGIVILENCFIARKELGDFLPQLKGQIKSEKFSKYRLGNICVRTGEDGRVFWGGMGKKSLTLCEDQYFWMTVEGRKVFYSLDTFFQANLFILPSLFKVLKSLPFWGTECLFYDLYGGVGLFSIGLIDKVKKSILIEETPASIELAQYNKKYHRLEGRMDIVAGRVEDELPRIIKENDLRDSRRSVAMIDPPRAGLSSRMLELLTGTRAFKNIIYLSCSPESLARDLKVFIDAQWQVQTIIPFDFFPRTKHIETLVVMRFC